MPKNRDFMAEGYTARNVVAAAQKEYALATIRAFPIGATVHFQRGRNNLVGVVNGYGWEAGYVKALNPVSGKTLKFYGFPCFGHEPRVLPEYPPRCQFCGADGEKFEPSDEHECGACICSACQVERTGEIERMRKRSFAPDPEPEEQS